MKMSKAHIAAALFAAVLPLSACASDPGEITRDTEPFSDIAETAQISALGTEPFWGIEVVPSGDGYEATYSDPDNIEGTAFLVERFAGNNGLSFSGEVDGGAVLLAITPGDCSDGMSDRSFPYTATLALGGETLEGCASTSDEPPTGPSAP